MTDAAAGNGVPTGADAAADAATLRFYGGNAQAYAVRERTRHARLARFLERLPPGAKILELGCGAGDDSASMLAAGFDARPTDGSPEMAEVAATRLGRPVATLLFHQLDEVEVYDAVWANACLLHVPRSELSQVLTRIWRALKPGGHFYASYKAGSGDGRDKLDRYYNYPTSDWLRATYAEAGAWRSLSIDSGEVKGFDNEQATMLFVVAQKGA